MKKVLIALNIVIWSIVCFEMAHAEAEMKQVCHDKMDKTNKPVVDKSGKTVQVCKTIKVHKKLEGDDKVPTKK